MALLSTFSTGLLLGAWRTQDMVEVPMVLSGQNHWSMEWPWAVAAKTAATVMKETFMFAVEICLW